MLYTELVGTYYITRFIFSLQAMLYIWNASGSNASKSTFLHDEQIS